MATIEESLAMHPGFYIREEMEARGWIQRDLAFILGCKEQAVNPILSGKRGISPGMAKALGNAFDVPAEFFLNLQKQYELAQAQEPSPGVAIRAKIQASYPVREMIKREWIVDTDAVLLEAQLVRFFEVQTVGEIPYLAHAPKKSRHEEREIPPAQLAWLFRVRQMAKAISVARYSEKGLRAAIQRFEGLMINPEDVGQVPKLLSECGVRFVVVESLQGSKIDGVCFWLDEQSPVIGLSARYDRIDNFWFVLRHEAEHVLCCHGRAEEIIDDLDGTRGGTGDSLSFDERVANQEAANFCVPSGRMESFMLRKHPFYYERDVLAFAALVQRHPGIVVGQMQRRLDNYSYLRRYQVKVRQFLIPAAMADGWGQSSSISI